MIWKIRDKLEAHLTKGELKDLLDANGQAIPKGESCVCALPSLPHLSPHSFV